MRKSLPSVLAGIVLASATLTPAQGPLRPGPIRASPCRRGPWGNCRDTPYRRRLSLIAASARRSPEAIAVVLLIGDMLVTFVVLVLGLLTTTVKSALDTADHDRGQYAAQLTQPDQCQG